MSLPETSLSLKLEVAAVINTGDTLNAPVLLQQLLLQQGFPCAKVREVFSLKQ